MTMLYMVLLISGSCHHNLIAAVVLLTVDKGMFHQVAGSVVANILLP